MLKKCLALSMCALTFFVFSACSNGQLNAAQNSKIKVLVTFDAMKEFVQAVGRDKVEISKIVPDGTEPHDFEPKAIDIAGLSTANVFVFNGLGMENWAADAVLAANNKNLILVEASKGAEAIINSEPNAIRENGQYDPHIWLSLKGAEYEAKNIRDGLIKADPSDKDYFSKNYEDFISQLEGLYTEYNLKFQSVKNRSIVTGHAAFAYIGKDFNLTEDSVEDVFAEGEPSAQQLARLVDYSRKNNVKTVFVEDMVNPQVSQTLANEVGAKVEKIYTIESSEGNLSYIERMKTNLELIYSSLSE